MNICVLGGCGFIGSHIVEALINDKHSVTIFDRSNADRKNILGLEDKLRFVGGDFAESEEIVKAIANSEVVIHLISSTLPSDSFRSPTYDLETNLIHSVRLFELCVKAKVRKIVFVSSGGTVYGIPDYLPIKEDHPLNPITPYGISKMAIEKYLGFYSYHYGIDFVILRLSNPYGERQNPYSGQGVIASWIRRAKNAEPIEIWGNGEIIRDYIYIKDAVNVLKKACLIDIEKKILNVGTGVGHSLLQVHRILEECVGRPIPATFKDVRKIDVPINVLDVSLLEALDWKAKVSLEEGIKKLWHDLSK